MATSDKVLDTEVLARLLDAGVSPGGYAPRQLRSPPVNTAGLPGLLAYDLPALQGTNTRGMVLPKKSPGEPDRMYLSPDETEDTTVAHEAEHLLAGRGLGHPADINKQFDTLVGNSKARGNFVRSAIDAAPYLQEKYGLKNAYFSPKMYQFQGSLAPNLLFEQLASLASVEATQGVDLTKDPVLRKTLFKDRNVRETYNAMTGLRQTRLDAKDIAPYTRLPEKEPSMVEKVKSLLGFAKGGTVPNAGNTKLI
jgi:hypothetical protein